MYFLVEGSVNILSATNENHVVKTLEKGAFFGDIALFSNNAKRMCSVVAATFC